MAQITLAVPSPKFSTSEDAVEFERRRPAWPASIAIDQSAVEQARKELGPDASAKKVLARAQQIKEQKQSERTAHAHLTDCWFEDEFCDCRELATVHQLGTDYSYCLRHFEAVSRG